VHAWEDRGKSRKTSVRIAGVPAEILCVPSTLKIKVPPKRRWTSKGLHGVTSHITVIFKGDFYRSELVGSSNFHSEGVSSYLAGTSNNLTAVPECLSSWAVTKLGHNHFLPHAFEIFIHSARQDSTLYRLSCWRHKTCDPKV
jgi:hypothetical protein